MTDTSFISPAVSDETQGTEAVTIVEGADRGGDDETPGVGTLLGRYVVVEAIGEGGMGRVLRAYDSKLHRAVALKLLRSGRGEEARARMIREAQAMAQLSHPNVVAVYDVETYEGRPFIAMEFVEGQSLHTWLGEARRPWSEVLEVFVAAGRGLSAAHRAGLVHRDFKPGNVLLVDDDGTAAGQRVRVTDFGLARGVENISSNAPPAILDSAGDTLTLAGAVMGTPAYMAPEQHASQSVDARSDQYAFCVSLWEALYGERPFTGKEVATAKLHPERLEFPSDGDVPRFFRPILRRGLSVNPIDRFASMDQLLGELTRNEPRTKTWLVLGGLAVGVTGWLVATQLDEAAKRAECESRGDEITQVYDATVAARIENRFHGTGSPIAEATLSRVIPRLDLYAQQWRELRAQTCVTAEVDDSDSATYALVTACLEERRSELEGTISTFVDADPSTVAYAVGTATAMSPIDDCTDPRRLHANVRLPEDEQHRSAVLAVRRELAGIHSLVRAGRYDDAEAAIPDVARRAEKLDFPPLLARARTLQADLVELRGDRPKARALYEEAFYTAGRAGADDVAASVAIDMVYFASIDKRDHQVGTVWAELARMLIDRMGQTDKLLQARLANNHAVLMNSMDRQDEAIAGYLESIELRRELFKEDEPGIATAYNNLATIYYDRKDLESARDNFEKSVEIKERLLGPRHPKGALPLRSLGELEYDARAYEDALMYLEDARDIYADVWGDGHMFVSNMHTRIGRIYYARGQYDVALGHHERALAIALAERGPDAPLVASLLNNVGQTYERLGLYEESLPRYEWALRIRRQQGAGSEYAQAFTKMLIGRNLMKRGQIAAALVLLEEAVAVAAEADAAAGTMASLQFALARAVWFDPDQRQRAYQLAEEAITNYERGGPWNDIWKAEVQAWLGS